MFKNIKKSSGAVSSILLILAVLLIILIVIVFAVIKINTVNTKKNENVEDTQTVEEIPEPEPVYDTTVGDVRFVLQSAIDLGDVLQSNIQNYKQTLTTTEKFILVTVGAQNKSKNSIIQYQWDVGNIIDSDGRNFVSINNQAYSFLPQKNLCGTLIKPEFEPVPCVRLYEVSKKSIDLKVQVTSTNQVSSKKEEGFLDLLVK